jgi:hypothetical protein
LTKFNRRYFTQWHNLKFTECASLSVMTMCGSQIWNNFAFFFGFSSVSWERLFSSHFGPWMSFNECMLHICFGLLLRLVFFRRLINTSQVQGTNHSILKLKRMRFCKFSLCENPEKKRCCSMRYHFNTEGKNLVIFKLLRLALECQSIENKNQFKLLKLQKIIINRHLWTTSLFPSV